MRISSSPVPTRMRSFTESTSELWLNDIYPNECLMFTNKQTKKQTLNKWAWLNDIYPNDETLTIKLVKLEHLNSKSNELYNLICSNKSRIVKECIYIGETHIEMNQKLDPQTKFPWQKPQETTKNGISNSKQCPLQTAHTRVFLQRAQTVHLMFTHWPSCFIFWSLLLSC